MVFFHYLFKDYNILKANGGDPDQTPRSVASHLGLHCLQMPHEKEAMLILAKEAIIRL